MSFYLLGQPRVSFGALAVEQLSDDQNKYNSIACTVNLPMFKLLSFKLQCVGIGRNGKVQHNAIREWEFFDYFNPYSYLTSNYFWLKNTELSHYLVSVLHCVIINGIQHETGQIVFNKSTLCLYSNTLLFNSHVFNALINSWAPYNQLSHVSARFNDSNGTLYPAFIYISKANLNAIHFVTVQGANISLHINPIIINCQ